jgi:hypothetical protein
MMEEPIQSVETKNKLLPIPRSNPIWTIQDLSYSLNLVSWMLGAELFLENLLSL